MPPCSPVKENSSRCKLAWRIGAGLALKLKEPFISIKLRLEDSIPPEKKLSLATYCMTCNTMVMYALLVRWYSTPYSTVPQGNWLCRLADSLPKWSEGLLQGHCFSKLVNVLFIYMHFNSRLCNKPRNKQGTGQMLEWNHQPVWWCWSDFINSFRFGSDYVIGGFSPL